MVFVITDDPDYTYIAPSLDTNDDRFPDAELTPEDYLEFAIRDLKEGGRRGLVNSFGNSKRCIHLLVDELLWQYGLLARNQKVGFPGRLELLGDLGILSAKILRRLNVQRNAMEHDYVTPSEEVTQDAVDVAGLLVLAASTLRRRVICEAVVGEVDTGRHLLMTINRKEGNSEFREISTDRIHQADGVPYVEYIRMSDGGLMPDVSVSDECIRKVSLKLSNRDEWWPIMTLVIHIQRPYSDTPSISVPITEEIYKKTLAWVNGPG
ncbi:hypothetical protein [Streptomyces sp. DH37]|uniref:hypothetical protein n=1 Tax=Streptomyces sp. DH37 TaxID=3040122 RepID=UPI0024429D6B|nr:hypothetical protein [Streptomyces sp. DH37]MDG9705456.1 hypothetical protein [Streptomyces sp. DH37]